MGSQKYSSAFVTKSSLRFTFLVSEYMTGATIASFALSIKPGTQFNPTTNAEEVWTFGVLLIAYLFISLFELTRFFMNQVDNDDCLERAAGFFFADVVLVLQRFLSSPGSAQSWRFSSLCLGVLGACYICHGLIAFLYHASDQ